MVINSVKIDNKPLSKKIINWSTLVLGIILFLFCSFTLIIVQILQNYEQDEHLRTEASFILKSISVELGKLHLNPSIAWEEQHHMEETENPIFIMIFNKDKSLYYNTQGMEDLSFANGYLVEEIYSKSVISIINISNNKLRFIVNPITYNNEFYGWLITSMATQGLNNTTKMLLTIYLIAFPLSLLITLLGSTITAQKAVNPIKQISEAARDIQANNPNNRLPVPQTKDEIAHLADTLNNLLDQVEKNIQNLRHFSQNASHELKSPLVLITAELEQMRQKLTDSSLSDGFYHIQQEVERMAKIIDSLLTLMKIDSKQSNIKKQTVWLNDLLFEEIARYQGKAKQNDIRINSNQIQSISLEGDPYWLSILFSNVIDNAIKYTKNNTTITLFLNKNSSDKILFRIVDEGPGAKESELKLLTKRFYRQQRNSNILGTGLGLSIVDWVVTSHNGSMEIKNVDSGGLQVSIELPI
jgi:signal transduction histidine kinase